MQLTSKCEGLVYLPQYLSVEDQRKAIIGCLTEASGPESRTNLDTHYVSPPHGWWKTFCESPDRVLQPRSSFQMRPCRSEVSEGPAQLSESRRVQTDLPPVDNSIHARELADAEGNAKKADPPASETVRPAALKDLIRKLRWTILGLEYHASSAVSSLASYTDRIRTVGHKELQVECAANADA